jgi:hypothetical protein
MAICDCDIHRFPVLPDIAPGLTRLPRQVGLFADFRASMLGRIRDHAALHAWRARDDEDLGLMLLEWWAYVADIVAFYNAEAAQDLYLGTARDDAALRGVTALIGYSPRPAIAAEAILAALADGSDPVEAPAGARFISDAIDDTPPQEFELTAATLIDPWRNAWTLAPIRGEAYDPENLLLDPGTRNLAEDALFVIDVNATRKALRAASVTPETALDGQNYLRLEVSDSGALPPGPATLAQVRLWAFAQTAPVRSRSGSKLILAGLYPQLRAGELVVVEDTGIENPADPKCFVVETVAFTTIDLAATGGVGAIKKEIAANTQGFFQFGGGGGGGGFIPMELDLTAKADETPKLTSAATMVTLKGTPTIPETRARLHFGRVRAGKLVAPALARIDGGHLAVARPLAGRHRAPTLAGTGELLLKGAGSRGERIAAAAEIDPDSGRGSLVPGGGFVAFTDPMRTPVEVHGNLLHVTRGKTVQETLGDGGGAGEPFQQFTLAKKPLTYVRDASAKGGRRSSLRVWCDGVEWRETESLFLAGPDDRVFSVTLDGEGTATVTFGDGTFGAPAPLGTGNVFAAYRFGAGDPAPGAGEIRQIGGPVPNLRRVFNPTSAFGGGPGDQPGDIRWNAPASAASFDRAVSAADFAAVARDFGALAAVAVSEWMPDMLRVGVVVTGIFDGEPDAEAIRLLREHLEAKSVEMLPVRVITAVPFGGTLRLSYRRSADAAADRVAAALDETFRHPFTGLLSPRRAAIGGPVFRSALLTAAAAVPGVATLTALTLDGTPAPQRFAIPAHGYLAPELVLEDVT